MNERVLSLSAGTLEVRHGGSGPLVVCTHAFGPTAWGQLERLQRSHTVAIPVWQSSTLDLETSLTLRWFDSLLDVLQHERAALCAWSMAGPSAISYAADAPERLSHLVLVDVAGFAGEPPTLRWRELPHAFLSFLLRRPTRGFVRALCRGWVHRKDFDTRELEAAAFDFFRNAPNALGAPRREANDEEPDDELESPLDELPEIAIPTLVMAGRHSNVMGPAHGATAAAALANGRLIVFEQSAHTPQLEEADAFQDALRGFLEA